jgi:hypothetical protein
MEKAQINAPLKLVQNDHHARSAGPDGSENRRREGKRRFVPANDEELFGNSPLPKRGNPMSVK